ncbi:NAD-dependent epimerase/dehydratase family protein [Aliidiomarina halalkaliphila]|uniref:NAD-dependent epimerase/dehydratase family protein n=1 Tax=Aliidiomarina halalkaliphila TaxID=2593535 RepID=A0A552X5E8_9GAMM|nr:NAD-dependent epimerase/dehydratase family protein [Aliidiomarina halalkaliphila]TRW50251.1 NAD-dependent epimerase/dehydratase family protein [Aliidiomarina halalkaliphila]
MAETPRVLLVGYGDIACRLTPLLLDRGFAVTGMRRHPERANLPELHTHSPEFSLVQGDACAIDDWHRILQNRYDAIIFTLTPSAYTELGYQQGYVVPVRTMLAAMKDFSAAMLPTVLYVSSTAVYGERDGEWVDEQTPTRPTGFSGEQLLMAENVLRDCGLPHVIVRASGIYGPGRERMAQSIEEGTYTITPAWTNRIHADDLARALDHLLMLKLSDEPMEDVYLATDDEPLQAEDYVKRVAKRLGVDASQLPRSNEIGPRGSKRLSNARLIATGFEFLHPTYE